MFFTFLRFLYAFLRFFTPFLRFFTLFYAFYAFFIRFPLLFAGQVEMGGGVEAGGWVVRGWRKECTTVDTGSGAAPQRGKGAEPPEAGLC